MRAISARLKITGAALAGLIYPFAFSPFDLFGLAPVALGVLFFVWRSSSPKQSAWCGFAFGMASFAVGVSWIYVSLNTFGNMPPVLAGIAVAVFGAIMALYPALVGWAQAKLSGSITTWRWVLFMPPLWILGEWLRGILLSGFPWLYLGYSQVDTPLSLLLPFTGTLGVGLWVTLATGLVLALFFSRSIPRVFSAIALLVLFGLIVIAKMPHSVMPDGDPVQVAVIQNNISLKDKWNPEQSSMIANRFLQQSLALDEVDLIVWPEAALPFYWDEIDPVFFNQLKQHDADYLIGLLERERVERGSPYYNVGLGVGAENAVYRKHQLVPFGEYLPFAPLLSWLLEYLQIPMSDFSSGPLNQQPMDLAGTQIGVSICYEDAFTAVINASALHSSALVNLSEDAWFGDSLAPHQRLQMARARALETGRPMIRASNSGLSAIISHDGSVDKVAPQFKAVILRGRVQPMSGTTPFVRLGNYPVIFMCLFLLAIGILRHRFWGQAKPEC